MALSGVYHWFNDKKEIMMPIVKIHLHYVRSEELVKQIIINHCHKLHKLRYLVQRVILQRQRLLNTIHFFLHRH
ncbi:hypothetical protein C2G38_2121248 [Gigaspora rosea]|uniref:Uncharacterized protein n=1 Tax=Gigaspora rosea TaxID=44941 RepID=A0A397UA60_9GLOM|nr:hypothetical protein C2G38_2121248 [Gigaspora rosea]